MPPPPAPSPVVDVHDLDHWYGRGDSRAQVLYRNRLEVGAGQIVVMTGPSGSGKTTLLTLIGAIRAVQEGRLSVLGRELNGLGADALLEVRRQLGFIFQSHHLLESVTAVENVLMAARVKPVADPDAARARAVELLERLGLGHRQDHLPSELSGGQRQRVAVARALMNQPRLILADEPTAALDKAASLEVVGLLETWTRTTGGTVIMVTHDNRILDVADRIVHMVDGAIVSDVMIREAVLVCDFLRGIEFFEQMGNAHLTAIAEKMRRRPFAAGEVLVRQGDEGHEFFLVREGRVEVTIEDAGTTRRAATLQVGQCFGERALLSGDRRAATVTALEAGAAYVLNKPDFIAAIESSPDFRTQLQQLYFGR